MSNRWPKLDLEFVPGLDYMVGEYDREWFLHFAKQFSDSGYGLVAGFFQHVASKPAAIKAINHHRPQIPRNVLGLNRALHYLVRLEILGDRFKEAREQVAKLWGTKALTIKDDHGDYGDLAWSLLESFWIKQQGKPGARARPEILKDLDSDLQHRSTFMSVRKRRRKK